jgi:hypothetical protein
MALAVFGQRVKGHMRVAVVADFMSGRGYFLDRTGLAVSRQAGDEEGGPEPVPLKEIEDAGHANF